jgi:hypothetical protein
VSTIPRPGHDVPGRWETPRTPGRKTYGPAIAEVARAIGKPLQPWQRRVLDVGTELLPDGRWAYPIVCVTVMRQAGKTTLLGPKSLHRCLIRPRVKTWITAQSRQDARDVWSDIADLVDASPIRELWNVRRSNGSEALGAPTGSTFRVFAPTEDALHGKANEAVDVDEVWAFDGLEGDALEQAILPTFTTTGGQLWLVSNAGTLTSTWLRKYVDRGRAAVDSGANTGIAYFEWSLSPAEAAEVVELLDAVRRVDDEEQRDRLALDAVDLVMARHPGQYVQRHALVEPFKTMSPGEVLRAYGNVWTVTADATIPDHLWHACRDTGAPAPDPGVDLALAFDVTLDRGGSIAASWVGPAPLAEHYVDALDTRPGTGWLPSRIEELAARWGVREVACDPRGPNLDVADELERRGKVKVRRLTSAEWISACSGLLTDVELTAVKHRGTTALDEAAAAAQKRPVGDRWVWSRSGPVAPLTAATVARYALRHRPPPMPKPQIVADRGEAPEARPPATRSRRSLTV